VLTTQQTEHYHQHGYVLLPTLFDTARIAKLDQRFRAYVGQHLKPTQALKLMRDVMVVKGAVQPISDLHGVNKLMNFEDDPVLYSYVQHQPLLDCVQSLLGPNVYSLSTNVFNKPPGVDGRHPLHQDLRYFRLRPADQIVGVWTAMLPANRRTGCLAVIPGSHQSGLLPHESPDWDFVNAGFYAVQGVDPQRRVHVPMNPGDTLLFHPLLVHGSGRNRSNDFRRAISTHFASSTAVASLDHGQLSPQIRSV